MSAARNGHTETCQHLVESKANINAQCSGKMTALILAAQFDRLTVQYLCGVPTCFIGAKDEDGKTALDWCRDENAPNPEVHFSLTNAMDVEKQDMVDLYASRWNSRVFTNAILDFCTPRLEKELTSNEDTAFMKARMKVLVQRSVGILSEYLFDYDKLTHADGVKGKRVISELKAARAKEAADNAAFFAAVDAAVLAASASSSTVRLMDLPSAVSLV